MNTSLTLLQPKPNNVARGNSPHVQSEQTVSVLALLTAQIVLLKQVEKNMHARLRPEIELILQSDPWRERGD